MAGEIPKGIAGPLGESPSHYRPATAGAHFPSLAHFSLYHNAI